MKLVRHLVTWLLGSHCRQVRDTSPADGMIEIHGLTSLNGEPNPRDPRFRRFLPPLSPAEKTNESRLSWNSRYPPLLGRVVIGSMFLGQDGRRWSELEEANALTSLIRAAEWIERQAMSRDARVNLQLLDVYFAIEDEASRPDELEMALVLEDHDEGLSEHDSEVRVIASLGRAVETIGFHDLGDFLARIAPMVEADSLVWVVHMRSAGRSFVVSESEIGMSGVSLAVCYAREEDFPAKLLGRVHSDSSTFAHELLHLFGASDKYGVPLSSFPKDSVTRYEIMRLDRDRLSQLRIDPLTASELGWPRETKPPASTDES